MPVPRLKDVARKSGVSVAAASLALSGKGRISQEVRARVRAAADELAYRVGVTPWPRPSNRAVVGVLHAEDRPYEWNFVRNLKNRMRRKAAAFPGLFPLEPLGRIWTVRQFDEAYTAPHHGFRDAADYYYRASALRVVDRIRVPTLVIAAEDDPFVPVSTFHDPAVTSNRNITTVITPHGGHCAYIEQARDGYDGYWAEGEIVRFAGAHAVAKSQASATVRSAI